jgi:hypothetical protein
MVQHPKQTPLLRKVCLIPVDFKTADGTPVQQHTRPTRKMGKVFGRKDVLQAKVVDVGQDGGEGE